MLKTEPFCDRMKGTLGYFDDPMSPPPAEKKANVMTLALTNGCSHNACTFCNMYKGRPYEVRTFEEFREHADDVLDYYRRNKDTLGVPDRIFIGAGNALSADVNLLLNATQYSLFELKRLLGDIPRRLAMYGNTADILKHGYFEMSALRCGGQCGHCSKNTLGDRRGLEVLYWGAESGNDNVLKIAGKGTSGKDARRAAEILNHAHIRTSMMVMPGLGGALFSEGHIEDTAALINRAKPEWVTFIGLKIWPNTPYDKWIKREEGIGRNRRLTDDEITLQTASIIERIEVHTTVGIHGDDVHTFGHNPNAFGAVEVEGPREASRLARRIRADLLLERNLKWFDDGVVGRWDS